VLRHTDRAPGLIERVAACFADHRAPDQVVTPLPALVGQRIVGIALGVPAVLALLGHAFADPPVSYVATVPGPAGALVALLTEATIAFGLTSNRRPSQLGICTPCSRDWRPSGRCWQAN
jgi:hypothetical protein